MESINYFLNMHGGIVSTGTVIIAVGLSFLVMILLVKYSNKHKWSDTKSKYIITPISFVIIMGGIFGSSYILDPYNSGGIVEIYYLSTTPKPQITLSLERIRSGGKTTCKYDRRLKTYDFITGNYIGMTEMLKGSYDPSYYIYRISDTKAWGRCDSIGYQYLDLAKPEHFPLNDLQDEKPDTSNSMKDHKAQKWLFDKVKGGLGFHAHPPGKKPTDKSLTLLEPELIDELNRGVKSQNKRWIIHKSALYVACDLLASYLNSSGELIKQMNLNKDFDNDNVNILKTLTYNGYIYLLITTGKARFGDIRGYTLRAVKTDPETGEIAEIIRYM